jgi:ferredoxin
MCEYCHKHGEGQKWYLQAKNYSQDLQSDLQKNGIFDWGILSKDMQQWEEIKKAPFAERELKEHAIAERVRNMHFGQVIPIEDVENIFGIVNSIVRMECICRKGKNTREQRYCFGISVIPSGEKIKKVVSQPGTGFLGGPNTDGLEKMDKDKTLKLFREYEKEGLCHSVWTQLTPFIVGLCNCDRADCGAMQSSVVRGTPIMYRAEYVAEFNPELCSGCRACMRVCQFGAIGYSAGNKKAYFDAGRCYGCGICRAACTKGAIQLKPRSSVPALANLW